MKRISIGKGSRSKARMTARSLLRELPNLFKLVFRLMRDPAVSRFDKALFGAVALYMMTPLDLIPDFLGVLGWVDDLYLLGMALGRIVVSAGPDRLLQHWDGNPKTLGFLVESVEELGGGLPARIRRGLASIVEKPSQLRRRKPRRPLRRIRVDEDARVHLEE
jgi:uncharacterized membrane protein YkvA (DUF1232 family)